MHARALLHKMALAFGALMILMMCLAGSALAATARVSASSAGVYKSTNAKAPAAKLKEGTVVTVLKAGDAWVKIKYNGKIGYMKKSSMVALKKATKATKLRSLHTGSSGSAVKRVQARLAAKGYLAKGGVTGKYGSSTKEAVRKFQMFNSLSISGTATVATQKKLFSSSARSEPNVSIESWGSSGIDSRFPNRSTAVIIDMQTGTRINIRRLYGSNHCDVEPKTKSDTWKLNAIYGGEWSWNSRGVVLIAGGKCFAAAINSMPHGGEISESNGYPGQFCLHLKGSKTHGTNRVNDAHQASIKKVYDYFH